MPERYMTSPGGVPTPIRTTLGPKRIGAHAVYCPPTTAAIRVPDNAAFNNLTSLTIELWCYPIAPIPNSRLFDKNLGSNQGYYLGLNGNLNPLMNCANGTTSNSHFPGRTLSLYTWHYLVGEWDGSNVYLWVDGLIASTTSKPLSGGTTGAAAGTMQLGNNIGGSTPWGGVIGPVRFSANTTRYAGSYASGNTIPIQRSPFVRDSATTGLWQLSENVGTTCYDSGPNALHGSFAGTPYPTWAPGRF